MGVFFGIPLALGLESLDITLKTPEEVEGFLDILNLAMIPHLEVAAGNPGKEVQELVVHHGSHPIASEAYRGLRTSILFSSPDQPPRILLITSSLPPLMSVTAAAVLGTMVEGVLLVVKDI